MNLLFKFLRIVLLAIIILPIWVSISLVGLFVTVILYILFPQPQNTELKCRNSIKKIMIEFKNHLFSIFYYF